MAGGEMELGKIVVYSSAEWELVGSGVYPDNQDLRDYKADRKKLRQEEKMMMKEMLNRSEEVEVDAVLGYLSDKQHELDSNILPKRSRDVTINDEDQRETRKEGRKETEREDRTSGDRARENRRYDYETTKHQQQQSKLNGKFSSDFNFKHDSSTIPLPSNIHTSASPAPRASSWQSPSSPHRPEVIPELAQRRHAYTQTTSLPRGPQARARAERLSKAECHVASPSLLQLRPIGSPAKSSRLRNESCPPTTQVKQASIPRTPRALSQPPQDASLHKSPASSRELPCSRSELLARCAHQERHHSPLPDELYAAFTPAGSEIEHWSVKALSPRKAIVVSGGPRDAEVHVVQVHT
eukprot:766938-Hanusia_phi.AAC.3